MAKKKKKNLFEEDYHKPQMMPRPNTSLGGSINLKTAPPI
jgi:hypothetical protein